MVADKGSPLVPTLSGALLFLLIAGPVSAQEIDLLGLSLGEETKKILAIHGEPDTTREAKDEVHWVYFLDENQETYMVLSFSKKRRDILAGIQVTGRGNLNRALLRGLRLGDPLEKVERVYGKPDVVEPVDEIKGVLYRYSNRNFSFEFVNNRLYSVRIQRKVFLPKTTFSQHLSL
jgi:hypothetical protein